MENQCLEAAGSLAPTSTQSCSVRTPRLLHWDAGSSTQVQECLPGSLDLKRYALEHFSESTPEADGPLVVEVGRALGGWLRSFHAWAAAPEQRRLRECARSNEDMRAIKMKYNYELLLSRIDKFPALLQDARPVFEELIEMARLELKNEDELQVIHGDFWTGK